MLVRCVVGLQYEVSSDSCDSWNLQGSGLIFRDERSSASHWYNAVSPTGQCSQPTTWNEVRDEAAILRSEFSAHGKFHISISSMDRTIVFAREIVTRIGENYTRTFSFSSTMISLAILQNSTITIYSLIAKPLLSPWPSFLTNAKSALMPCSNTIADRHLPQQSKQ